MRLETASLPMSCSSPARLRSRWTASLHPHRPGDRHRVGGDPGGVAGRVGRLRVDHAAERLGDAVQLGVAGHQDAVVGLPARGRRDGARVLERAPERGVVAEREQRVDERGIEPAAAALDRHPVGAAGAHRAREHLDGLREAQDPPEQRDLLAAQAERVAVAVPVLVERLDRQRGRLGQLEHAGDLAAALAARADHLARDLVLPGDRAHPARLGQRGAARLDRAPRVEREAAGAGPVDALHGRLAVWSSAPKSERGATRCSSSRRP